MAGSAPLQFVEFETIILATSFQRTPLMQLFPILEALPKEVFSGIPIILNASLGNTFGTVIKSLPGLRSPLDQALDPRKQISELLGVMSHLNDKQVRMRGEEENVESIEKERQQMFSRRHQLLTELHGAGPDAEWHVCSQFGLRAAEDELSRAGTAIQLLETGERVQQIIDRGRMALDQFAVEQLKEIAGTEAKEEEKGEANERREEPELTEEIMGDTIKQLQVELDAKLKKEVVPEAEKRTRATGKKSRRN
ncbi:hypothetical protein CBR_g23994 [Chara braunii]|uniref:Uncharacterized protein n=1 Tax=Chara braunii TaxID=69332 RepID=A0A388L5F0_CHABU|nr:hypothetical protein CBR_g23994 [Chara braunii]|eukprot:GBG77549.1 hypothetical protein CBR_g23994 [Chara braunii]